MVSGERFIASMGSRHAFVLHVLVVAAIGLLLCVNSSAFVDASTKFLEMSRGGGVKANLIHRDQYFADDSIQLTHRDRLERDAARSKLRARVLASRSGSLAASLPTDVPISLSAPSTRSPTPAPSLTSAQAPAEDFQTVLSDAADAEYLMEISLGTPPQKFVAVADTGSDLTWLQCSPCPGCSTGSLFQPNVSTTYSPLTCSSSLCLFLNETGQLETGLGCPVSNATTACPYTYEYNDRSETFGSIASDTITLQIASGGSAAVTDFQFGCSNNVTTSSALLDATDGLVGLGRGNISFTSQLGKYFGNVFGYCLVDRTLSTTVKYSSIFFGPDAVPVAALTGPQVQMTPMVTNGPTIYYIGWTGITLNGTSVANITASDFEVASDGSGGMILDSGTTFTQLVDQIFNPLTAAIQTKITKYTINNSKANLFPLCYNATWSEWANDYGKGVPDMSFQFSNTTGFTLGVDAAWIQTDDTLVCLAMFGDSGTLSIFGNHQQVNHRIFYDLDNLQIGFVQANCSE